MSNKIFASELPKEDIERLNWLLEHVSEIRWYEKSVFVFISKVWIEEFFEAMGYTFDDGTKKLEYNGGDFVIDIQHDLSPEELSLLKEAYKDE